MGELEDAERELAEKDQAFAKSAQGSEEWLAAAEAALALRERVERLRKEKASSGGKRNNTNNSDVVVGKMSKLTTVMSTTRGRGDATTITSVSDNESRHQPLPSRKPLSNADISSLLEIAQQQLATLTVLKKELRQNQSNLMEKDDIFQSLTQGSDRWLQAAESALKMRQVVEELLREISGLTADFDNTLAKLERIAPGSSAPLKKELQILNQNNPPPRLSPASRGNATPQTKQNNENNNNPSSHLVPSNHSSSSSAKKQQQQQQSLSHSQQQASLQTLEPLTEIELEDEVLRLSDLIDAAETKLQAMRSWLKEKEGHLKRAINTPDESYMRGTVEGHREAVERKEEEIRVMRAQRVELEEWIRSKKTKSSGRRINANNNGNYSNQFENSTNHRSGGASLARSVSPTRKMGNLEVTARDVTRGEDRNDNSLVFPLFEGGGHSTSSSVRVNRSPSPTPIRRVNNSNYDGNNDSPPSFNQNSYIINNNNNNNSSILITPISSDDVLLNTSVPVSAQSGFGAYLSPSTREEAIHLSKEVTNVILESRRVRMEMDPHVTLPADVPRLQDLLRDAYDSINQKTRESLKRAQLIEHLERNKRQMDLDFSKLNDKIRVENANLQIKASLVAEAESRAKELEGRLQESQFQLKNAFDTIAQREVGTSHNRRVEELMLELEREKRRNDELQRDLLANSASPEKLKAAANDFEKERQIAKLVEQLQLSQEENARKDVMIREKEAGLVAQEEKVKEYVKMAKEWMSQRLSKAQQQLDATEEELRKEKAERARLAASEADLTTIRKQLENEIYERDQRLSSFFNENGTALRALDQMRLETVDIVNVKDSELEKMRQAYHQVLAQNQTAQRTIDEMSFEMKTLSDKVKTLTDHIEMREAQLREEALERAKEIEEERDARDQWMDDRRRTEEQFSQEIANLKRMLDDRNKRIASLAWGVLAEKRLGQLISQDALREFEDPVTAFQRLYGANPQSVQGYDRPLVVQPQPQPQPVEFGSNRVMASVNAGSRIPQYQSPFR